MNGQQGESVNTWLHHRDNDDDDECQWRQLTEQRGVSYRVIDRSTDETTTEHLCTATTPTDTDSLNTLDTDSHNTTQHEPSHSLAVSTALTGHCDNTAMSRKITDDCQWYNEWLGVSSISAQPPLRHGTNQTPNRIMNNSTAVWRPLLPYRYSYKASRARPGLATNS